MTRIQLESVSKRYGPRLILQSLTLAVEAGERLAVLGPSGCGKTTLLRLVAGLTAPDLGRVLLAGAVASEPHAIRIPPERRRAAMVFQDMALWPHLTVDGNLRFGLEAHGVPRAEADARIASILHRIEIEPFARSRPGELSGGEQQRVALARALVLEPEILLMDEPLASLNPQLAARLAGMILEIHAERAFTLLYVTHRPAEALRLGTRILVMDEGRVVALGRSAELGPDVLERGLP